MLRFAQVTVAGVASVILFKLLATFLFPLMAWLIGFVVLALKIGLIVLVGYMVYRFFKGRKVSENDDDE